jgi:ATP-dependent NAD(P)H-hydrate dehydratase
MIIISISIFLLLLLIMRSVMLASTSSSSSVTCSPQSVLAASRLLVPKLSNSSHKGQAGRVAVIGGSFEYTGAPFYAAMAALRGGADLASVFCYEHAAIPIKSYSPELIVFPTLEIANDQLARFSAVCIGPGLGRAPDAMKAAQRIVEQTREAKVPLVLDGDALWWANDHLDLLRGHPRAVITPNAAEFDRLYRVAFSKPPPPIIEEAAAAASPEGLELDLDSAHARPVVELSEFLGGVTVVRKGRIDIISDGKRAVACGAFGSPRRCGGQGDVLAGLTSLFAGWAGKEGGSLVNAAFAACVLTRRSNMLAFNQHGRSMTTPDMLKDHLGEAFRDLFEPAAML